MPNSSEIGANFKAGRPVKIFVGYNGEMVCVFTGFIGRPKVNIVSSTVELEAFDAMSYFETQEIQQSYFENQKIKDILKAEVACIESLDRWDAAEKLQQRLEYEDKTIEVLIQVNTSYEDSKFGLDPSEAVDFVKKVGGYE